MNKILIKLRTLTFLAASFCFVAAISGFAHAQTATSLAWKKDGEPLQTAASPSGNLYKELLHHGPALENSWAAYRVFFNNALGIDVYSKKTPRLELQETQWYTSDAMIEEGYGSDHFLVSGTPGLGSVRLWENGQPRPLATTAGRSTTVRGNGSSAHVDVLSSGIEYDGETVDLLMRLTAYADRREASVDVFVLADQPVQLAIGLVRQPDVAETFAEHYAFFWGTHPPSAQEKNPVPMGAAVILPPSAVDQRHDTQKAVYFVTKPLKHLRYWITTASSIETPPDGITTEETFASHLQDLLGKDPMFTSHTANP